MPDSECRRPGELTVTYNPSFSSSAGPSSPLSAAAAGSVNTDTESCVASLASSTQTSPGTTSSFSPQSTCRPPTLTHDARQAAPPIPLHRPHSVTGLLYHLLKFCTFCLVGERSIVMSMYVVCLFVCLFSGTHMSTSNLNQTFCACYLWLWLDFFWRHRDMLHTSGFVDDVVFLNDGQK